MQKIQRIINFAGNYNKYLYWSIFFSALSAIFMLVPYLSIYNLITLSFNQHISAANIFNYGYLALGGILLDIISYFISLWLSHMAGFRIERNMRIYGINKLLDVGLSFFDSEESGAIRKTIDDNASLTHSFVAHNIPDIIRSVVGPMIILVSIFLINWLYGFLILMIVIISLFLLSKMMGNTSDIVHYMDSLDEMNSSSTEFIRGMSLVKLFNVPLTTFKRFRQSISNYGQWALNYSLTVRLPYVINQIVLEAFPLLIVFTLKNTAVISDSGATTLFCIIISSQIILLLTKVLSLGESFSMAIQAVNRIDNMFDGYSQTSLFLKTKEKISKDFSNDDIFANNIEFSYSKSQPVLNDISFTIPKKKMTVIVGASGSGKSTIAKLLIGAYREYSGNVLIGNQNIKNMSEDQLMENITYISQNSKLFTRSILDNLKIANPDATEEQIKLAIKLSCCDELIAKMPNGLNTLIGNEGVHLSGGEQQRLSLCQAFLRKAKIVILDEVTASIDSENEEQMQEAIIHLAKEKTLILIDHKLKITKYADQILVFNHGNIVERGTHLELVDKHGKYSEMIHMHQQTQKWQLGVENK